MSGRFGVGLSFLLLGIAFLLHQANFIDIWQALSIWWPLVVIVIGVVQLFKRENNSPLSGIMFCVIGLLFLLNQWLDLNVTAYIWPLILIFIGLAILFSRNNREKPSHTEDDLNATVLFSGAEIKSRSQNFQGGSVMTIFGGAEIDLRDAVITDGASIDLTTVLGGAELKVPENVRVEISGVPILGGWEDKTKVREDSENLVMLKINCLTIMGGLEIRN